MKLFLKLMLALLFIALLLPFTILKDDDGNTLMSVKDISLPEFSLPDLSSARSLVPDTPASSGMDKFYKWYDSEGNVQFTTEPPPDGVEYTVKEYDPDTNLIQAVELPKEEAPEKTTSLQTGNPAADAPTDDFNPYSKEKIEKLMEDTKNIEKLLNQRVIDQNNAINQ